MAISRNNLSMKLTGRVGAYSYYTTTGGRQIARVAQNSSNYGESATRTEAQQNRRSKWGNLVNFYKMNKTFFRRAFESKASNQSDYNKFMSINLPTARVALTKNDYALGGCVLDGFRVSEGSLRGITDGYKNGALNSVLNLDTEGALGSVTVGNISNDLLINNNLLREGDQISYVYWRQFVTVDRVPRFYSEYFEITLDKSSEIPFSSLPNSDLIYGEDGIMKGEMDHQGALAAFILTRQVNGALQVSTETAILNSDIFLSQWTGEAAEKKAIASYGVNDTAFLEPGSAAQQNVRPAPTMVNIKGSSNPETGGKVVLSLNPDPSSGPSELNAPAGTVVYAKAIPNEGFTFLGWSTGEKESEITINTEQSVNLIAFWEHQGV